MTSSVSLTPSPLSREGGDDGWRRSQPNGAQPGGGPSADVLIEASGLHTFYGVSHILHGVDFSVRSGETIGLMGRNGMGKTTLLKTMLGLVRPREGLVKVRGVDMTQAATHAIVRRGIAYVPEGRGIFPNLSVR